MGNAELDKGVRKPNSARILLFIITMVSNLDKKKKKKFKGEGRQKISVGHEGICYSTPDLPVPLILPQRDGEGSPSLALRKNTRMGMEGCVVQPVIWSRMEGAPVHVTRHCSYNCV